MHNYEIAEYFSLLSKLMEIHGENPFKIKSYSNAAFTLDKLNDPVIDMEPHQLFSIRGIGEAIGRKVIEIIDSKRLSLLDSYIEKTPTGVFEFLILGGILAGLPALVTEFSLLTHKMPEAFAKIFEIIAEFLVEVTGMENLLLIIGGFCAAMTLYQLIVEFKHLFGGHGGEDHSEEGAKPEGGEAPVAPAPAA
jgi:DNA polymerase/3'-5' exonuclease PolX